MNKLEVYETLSQCVQFINGCAYWSNHKYKWLIGKKAGSDSHGYVRIKHMDVRVPAHHLNWFMHYNEIPTMLDHINGDKKDNRIENLRKCNYSQNNRNRKSAKGSSSKFLGVSWNKKSKKWAAKTRINGKCVHLGYYHNEDDAGRAYDSFCIDNNIEFARLNFDGSE